MLDLAEASDYLAKHNFSKQENIKVYPNSASREIRKFHVVVVEQRQKCTKRRDGTCKVVVLLFAVLVDFAVVVDKVKRQTDTKTQWSILQVSLFYSFHLRKKVRFSIILQSLNDRL